MRGTQRFLSSVALIVTLMVPVTGRAQQWSGIIHPSRAINWSNVGVPGGIPTATTVCATLSPGVTTAQINAAIAGCGGSAGNVKVVQLAVGTYNINGITFNGTSYVVLRGAGANQTFLVFSGGGDSCHNHFSDVCVGQTNSETNWQGGPTNIASWTAGYQVGATNITLSAVTNMKVGQPILLDQADDTADTGQIFVCSDNTISPPCSLEDNVNNSQRKHHNQVQIVTVVSCGTANVFGQVCNGTNVTISPGLYMANWSAAKSPQAWWATAPLYSSGVENLSADNTNSSGARGFTLYNCLGCWIKGVRSIDSGKAQFEVAYTKSATVRDNYAYKTQTTTTSAYGFHSFNTSDTLVENNIFQYIPGSLMVNSDCSGCVLGYNYGVNDYYTASAGWMESTTNNHGGGQDFYLYEGNVGNQVYADVFHGTHNLITNFRNYWSGYQLTCSNGSGGFQLCNNPLVSFRMFSYSRYYNIVGNVLGYSGITTSYSGSNHAVYDIGSGNTNGTVTVPPDSLVGTTLMRWGNYDVATGAVRWCGNSSNPGWTTICGSVSEVPTGLSSYANPVPATTTLPASFYLSTKPSWWPSGKAWPAIGPDVTGGNVPNAGGHAYTTPAEDCYLNVMGGPADGTGPVLNFNAATCYTNSSSSLPAPPSGL